METEPEFFQAGRTYQRKRWMFQCLAVAPEPFRGQQRAVGFLYREGENATATSMNHEDWSDAAWVDVSD